jgi:signal transduction histidine kinase
LTTLRLYLDLLSSGMVRDEKQRDEYLTTLNAESDRLHRLIGNVLDFARLERQRPRLEMNPVSPAGLLDQVKAMWEARCGAAGKELVVECDLPAGVRYCTDGRLLEQIASNLIDNACKYTREAADKRVWLRARPGRPGHWQLEVEDRGPGVTGRERRSVFLPFRRGRGVDATAGGVGLGLALARRWVALLGGRLTVRTAPGGVGACFRVELPARPECGGPGLH